MRRMLGLGFLILFATLGSASKAYAQRQLSSRDRALLYYYGFYNQKRTTQSLYNNQQELRRDVNRIENRTQARTREFDSIDRYSRGIRSSETRDPKSLPRIYGGQGSQKQYFMRQDYFNPSQPLR